MAIAGNTLPSIKVWMKDGKVQSGAYMNRHKSICKDAEETIRLLKSGEKYVVMAVRDMNFLMVTRAMEG